MKKLYLLLALALLVIAPLAVNAQDDAVVLTIMAPDGTFAKPEGTAQASDVGSSKETQYQMLQDYTAAHPNITFDVHDVPFGDLDSTELAALEANQGADILDVNSVTVGSFIDRGYLAPMDDLIKKNGLDTSIFYPGMLSSAVFNNVTYGLPIDTGTRVLYWNKKLFAAAGLQPPTDWSQIPDLAKKLTDTSKGVYGFVATSGEKWLWLYEHAGMYALANGLSFVNADDTQCTLNQGNNVQAIQFWVDLYKEGVMSQDALLTGTGPEREQAFGNNKAAMYLGGFWSADTLKSQYNMTYPDDYGIVALKGSAGVGSATGGWIFSISKNSQHQQEALDFIAWILGDPQRLANFTGLMPATSGAAALTLKGDFYQPFKDLLNSPNTRHPIPLNPGLPEQAETLRTVTQAAILGQMTAQQAADSFCQQIQDTLRTPSS